MMDKRFGCIVLLSIKLLYTEILLPVGKKLL